MRVDDLVKFIEARERHREAKEAGVNPVPRDAIIGTFRFCNVRRNDDRVTKWIHQHYMRYFGSTPYMFFALTVARIFNNEDTLKDIRHYVLPFSPAKMRARLKLRSKHGKKNFNAAYIISTNGRSMDKVDYVIDFILRPMWRQADFIARRVNNTGQLANAHLLLQEQNGLGSFMAAQILADLKYAPGHTWDDFATFVASGPGSRRGLNRVMGEDVNQSRKEMDFRRTVNILRDSVNAKLEMEPLTAQDIQNCLCEFDKYERARLGEGRPKQLYTPKENDNVS